MKALNETRSAKSSRTAPILLLVLLCAVGCRTTGYQKSDVTARLLQKAAAEVQAETREIEVTLAALNNLVTKPEADLKPQFRRFNAALNRLTESAEQTDRTRLRMEKKGAKYFEAWDQRVAGINYGKIREQSEARKADVTNRFHSVNARYLEAQGVVWPLITYFNDIRTALSVDLTAAGLESVKEIVGNADQNARKVQIALSRLSDELTSSGTALSSIMRGDTPPSQETETVRVRNSE